MACREPAPRRARSTIARTSTKVLPEREPPRSSVCFCGPASSLLASVCRSVSLKRGVVGGRKLVPLVGGRVSDSMLELHVVIADDELDHRRDVLFHIRAEERDHSHRVKVAGCGLVGELTCGNLDARHLLALAVLGNDDFAAQRLPDCLRHGLVARASPARITGLPFAEAGIDRWSPISDRVVRGGAFRYFLAHASSSAAWPSDGISARSAATSSKVSSVFARRASLPVKASKRLTMRSQ